MADGKVTKTEDEFSRFVIQSDRNYEKTLQFWHNASRFEYEKESARLCLVMQTLDSRTKTGTIKPLIRATGADRKRTENELTTIYDIAQEIDATEQYGTRFKNAFGREVFKDTTMIF